MALYSKHDAKTHVITPNLEKDLMNSFLNEAPFFNLTSQAIANERGHAEFYLKMTHTSSILTKH